jgi:antitoxin CptB
MRSDDEFNRRRQRLAWDCRRGMKELDIVLQPFAEQHFATLDRTGQEAFLDLLDAADPDLFDWFTAGVVPADAQTAATVRRVLAALGMDR